MKPLRKLIEDRIPVKTTFKTENEGVCAFCGSYTEVSRKPAREVIRRENNPGITLTIRDYPYICEDCSIVYENLTKPSPRQVFSEGRFLVIDKNGDYRFIKSIEELESLAKSTEEYLILYLLEPGRRLPTNFYDVIETINPSKNLVINAIETIRVNPYIYETKDLIEKIKDKNYKSEYLINSMRKELK